MQTRSFEIRGMTCGRLQRQRAARTQQMHQNLWWAVGTNVISSAATGCAA